MRHRVAKTRLSRSTSHRVAMMRNMVTSLIEHERIETTLAKAKQLRGLADRMVTLGKDGSLPARRRALSIVRKKDAVSKLFTTLAERFKERAGGYTRVLKLGFRHGDGASMALVEYLGYVRPSKEEGKEGKKASAAAVSKKETKKKKAEASPEAKSKIDKKPRALKKSPTDKSSSKVKPRINKAGRSKEG